VDQNDLDNVVDVLDLREFLFGNVGLELLVDSEHHLHARQRVNAEFLGEGRLLVDLFYLALGDVRDQFLYFCPDLIGRDAAASCCHVTSVLVLKGRIKMSAGRVLYSSVYCLCSSSLGKYSPLG
jgi:hypothetical protein